MTTLANVYDAAFDVTSTPEDWDTSTRTGLIKYVKTYADGGMNIILTNTEADKIADFHFNQESDLDINVINDVLKPEDNPHDSPLTDNEIEIAKWGGTVIKS